MYSQKTKEGVTEPVYGYTAGVSFAATKLKTVHTVHTKAFVNQSFTSWTYGVLLHKYSCLQGQFLLLLYVIPLKITVVTKVWTHGSSMVTSQ